MIIKELRTRDARELFKDGMDEPQEIHEWLKNNGFIIVGSGFKSSVYSHEESNVVVKLNHKEDKCWNRFVDIAKRNPVKSFPKIGCVRHFNYKGGIHTIVLMEKLYNINDNFLLQTLFLSIGMDFSYNSYSLI